jgi:hypothetical protein
MARHRKASGEGRHRAQATMLTANREAIEQELLIIELTAPTSIASSLYVWPLEEVVAKMKAGHRAR